MEQNSLVKRAIKNSEVSKYSAKFKKVFASFLINCESQNTVVEYARISNEFFNFVSPFIKKIEDLDRVHVFAYKKHLKDKNLANKTILKKLSAVSSLCKFLANEQIISKDLTYGLKRPKTHNRKETKAFTENEVKKIFKSLNPNLPAYYSHRAILAVGFYTGLRNSEIRLLKVSSYTKVGGHQILKTIIKGDNPHEVPLNPFVIKCIDEHLGKIRQKGLAVKADDYLFPRTRPLKNAAISAKGLRSILLNAVQRAKIDLSEERRFSPHSMRATLATHLLNQINAPLEDVQKLLGHKNPSTTQKYNKKEKSHKKSPVYKINY